MLYDSLLYLIYTCTRILVAYDYIVYILQFSYWL